MAVSDEQDRTPWIELETEHPIWDRFLWVAPLVVIGTLEEDGSVDMAPKHMAIPFGWSNYFGFICTPAHATYGNARREGGFAVSYPPPDQVVVTSLTASPRCGDGSKQELLLLPTARTARVPGAVLKDAVVTLECALHEVIDGFGDNSLIVGRVVAAHARREALLRQDRDPQDVLSTSPLLAYLNPGRFAKIHESNAFPLPDGFRR